MARISRRAALGTLGAAVVGAPALLRGRYRVFAGSPQEYSSRAVGLLRRGIVVDLLNQFLVQVEHAADELTRFSLFQGESSWKGCSGRGGGRRWGGHML